MEGFTAHQASKFTGCTPRQLRYWDQIGLVQPSVQSTGGRPGSPRLYAFRDSIALRVVALALGRRDVAAARATVMGVPEQEGGAWTSICPRSSSSPTGESIFKICRRDGEVMDALKDGQMAFFVAIDDIATSVPTNVRSFEEDRERFVRGLREAAAQTSTGS